MLSCPVAQIHTNGFPPVSFFHPDVFIFPDGELPVSNGMPFVTLPVFAFKQFGVVPCQRFAKRLTCKCGTGSAELSGNGIHFPDQLVLQGHLYGSHCGQLSYVGP